MLITLPYPTINLSGLRLCPPNQDDAEELFFLLTDHESTRYYGNYNFNTMQDVKNAIYQMHEDYRRGKSIDLVIRNNKNPKIVGFISAYGLDNRHARATFSFIISPLYRRRHIATATLHAFSIYMFTKRNTNRIQFLVDKRNEQCLCFLSKWGAKYEGVLRHYEIEEKECIDIVIFSIVKDEYTAESEKP